jgi:Ca2+-binding RTX toxin-like protein
MVVYIKSDLEFILKQIKIAEDHALFEQSGGTQGKPLFGPTGSIPTYNLAWGLRTVDGTYNNPLYPERGAADNPFPEHLGTDYRPAEGTDLDMDGPGGQPPVPTAPNYNPSNSPQNIVVDGSVRTISNLIVDQTLGNPSAILTALQRAGIVAPADQMTVTGTISAAYEPLKPLFNAVNTAAREHAEASAAASASPQNEALQQAAADALAALEAARAALDASDDALMTLLTNSGIELSGANVVITNTAPDEGLSAPFNSWFTLFGQFFDHGLDLVAKGGSGTVFIPLQADDPLYDPASPTNFMVLTRASVGAGTDGIMNTADDVRPVNNTTSFVDQNQTYTSHPSHQVFLRQYELVNGRPVATGNLIEGDDGGMATWADVKAQARDILGIELLDVHVGNLPLLATDAYGNFIPDLTTGFPQVVMAGPPQSLASGTPEAPLSLVDFVDADNDPLTPDVMVHLAVRTGHAFLADIAHNAVPDGLADGDIEIGLNNPGFEPGDYDNELLDAHFIAGDGRANENIGLTAVHHVFHAEHNRLVQHTKEVVFADAEAMLQDGASQAEAVAFLNEWLAVDVAEVPATAAGLSWDGERLFQAAKFGTEMQYQHLVFEEFARKIQPNINVFLVPDGYDVTLDPSIVAEFAHVVYRFGHSMLTETIDRFDPTFTDDHIGLIEGFLNPLQFRNNGTGAAVEDGIAAGAIIRGMTRQVGNEIDEFVTSALRNNLLGLPLDLATINLARGRDTGVPSLNDARAQFYAATNQDALLKPYESWVDFAGHLKHEASIINFIAAYGTHALITGQTTIEGKRDAAMTLIFNQSFGGLEVQADAGDFLNATGAYAGGTLGGLNNVDLWIGGLAEAIMPFGGMLGSTFNFVFETQMENLQNGDRFYYLQRLDGLHLFGEMENNSFAAMIMRNTDATHLPSDVFSTPGLILEVDQTKQFNDLDGDGTLESTDPVGDGILTPLVARNNPATAGADTNYLRYTGGDHVVLGGTDPGNAFNPSGNDILIAGIGDDTLFGDGGDDLLEGGFGNDIINAGDGDDIIKDSGGDDNIKAGAGHDVVHAGPGLDLVMGNDGQDFIFLGTDMGSEVFAGTGNDFIFGNKNAERILGNEGNDWIETGTFDGAPGDNFDEIFAHDGIDGHDVFLGDGGFDEFIGEGGDDIMVGSAGRGKMAGMSGFDWATYKDNLLGVNADLSIPIIFDEAPTLPQNAALDEYESMEGLSGTRFNDVLAGTNDVAADRAPLSLGGTTGFLGSALDAEGIDLIAGLQAVLGAGVTSFSGGDIILGGDGSDTIMGRAGDDIIDGDKWLNVRIGIMSGFDLNGPTGTEVVGNPNIKSMTSLVTLRLDANGDMVTAPTGGTPTTKSLSAWMFEGKINPGQLQIIREITATGADDVADIDTARFGDLLQNYSFGANPDGSITVSHSIVSDGLESDGTDKLSNIEQVQFSNATLGVIVGTQGNDTLTGTAGNDLILGLGGNDTLNGLGGDDILVGGEGSDTLNGGDGNDILAGGPNGAAAGGTFIDDFGGTVSYADNNGTLSFNGPWTESGGEAGGPTGGDININNGRLRFQEGIDGGETIARSANLSGYNSATLSFAWEGDDLDNGETVSVQAFNGTTWDTLDTLGGDGSDNFSMALTAAQIGAHTAIRFVANGTFDTGAGNAGENFFVDNFTITASTVETLNGGNGDDTYQFTFGDGNDVINELANGGGVDRIQIISPNIDPVSLLPVLTSLNAADTNTGTQNGNLVITYEGQQITVNGHFSGTNAQTGIERINFGDATYNGYLLGPDDYFISRSDPTGGNRTINVSTNAVTNAQQNFIAGEDGTNDEIIGGALNDLIFGGTGDNELNGGAGDDLLIGGSGAGDNDILDGGLDADTMVGLGGNDTYIVDDLGDVVIEAAGAGTDEVQTLMAALSIEAMANIENLTYTGADADPFVGTGNGLNNIITGGDLADTLSGLLGNDTLNGGLGADSLLGGDGSDTLNGGDDNDTLSGGIGTDTLNGGAGADVMAGGADNDIYVVDDAGDVVDEIAAGSTGIDRVDSSISYTLGANVENLNLTGGGAINGTGNALANVINGNGSNNQLFGGGENDTIDGGNGSDLIDGGTGNDTLSGGIGNDADTLIGGAGNDTINLLANDGGNDILVYNAAGFGADIVTNFDATGGTATTQDLIDLSALGINTGNFAARVGIAAQGANTLVTVRDASLAAIGTIQINGVTSGNITQTDFQLAAASTVLPGATAANNTLNGTAGNDIINALAGNDTVNGNGGNDIITGGLNGTGGPGADILNGDAGDDTIIWNANNAAANSLTNSDGSDRVNGGTEGAGGDTFVINGNANAETYRIYTLAAWDAVGGNNLNSFNGRTPEIVITRGGTAFANVIAELSEIEEIRINGFDPSATGTLGGDSVEIIGDFSGTSLRLNTITIDGDVGDDTVDISALTSAHRIVFRSNGGNDTIIGALQAEDVIELPEGSDISTYNLVENENGTKTISNGTHSVTFTGVVPPQFQTDAPGDGEEENETPPEDDEATPSVGTVKTGTAAADVLMGTAGDDNIIAFAGDDVAMGDAGADAISAGEGGDFVSGGAGRDVIFAGAGDDQVLAGADNDIVYGDAGADRIFGDQGNDMITAGAGDDAVFGGAGDDLFVAEVGDGNDVYFGDEGGGGTGIDTLDMSAATANVTVNLGSGALSHGTASSSQTGNDTIWGIENVSTGSGNDTITASNAVNVINGGAGNDTFKFTSTVAANGDTIVTFEPGDRIDLTAIDANIGTAGDQSFTLVSGAPTAAGQLGVTLETRADGDVTVIQGNIDGNAEADFTIEISGHHNLTNANLGL